MQEPTNDTNVISATKCQICTKRRQEKEDSMTTSEIVPKPSKVDHTQEELKEGKGNKIPSRIVLIRICEAKEEQGKEDIDDLDLILKTTREEP